MQRDTIVAIATPTGEGALGIIRVSGPGTFEIIKKAFHPSSQLDISLSSSHSVHYGHIKNFTKHDSYIDEVMVTVMRAPRSYTKEDTIEISGHGNPLILHRILDILTNAGARLAEPGEFTKRAFLNGRIDLSQAEAVADIINAKTEEASKSALRHLKGHLSSGIRGLQDSLKEMLTLLEAEIDFPNEKISAINIPQLHEKLKELLNNINALIKTHFHGKILKEGIYTAIIGKANVGKSSLFNLLTETSSPALVTHIPGTTRDIIEESIKLNGKLFRIMDTAGLKSPRGLIEKESLKISRDRIKTAMCNILLFDSSKFLSQNDLSIASEALKKPTLIVINKTDLPQKISIEKVKCHFPKNIILKISCIEKKGIENVKESLIKLSEKLYNNNHKSNSEIIITNVRHKNLLENVRTHVNDSIKALEKGFSSEFISTDLQHGLENLQEISGERISEEILNNIFSKFCIGK